MKTMQQEMNDYQQWAMSKWGCGKAALDMQLVAVALGLCGESAEAVEVIDASVRATIERMDTIGMEALEEGSKDLNAKLTLEMGDVTYYLAVGLLLLDQPFYSEECFTGDRVRAASDLTVKPGFFADYMKKVVFHSHSLDREKATRLMRAVQTALTLTCIELGVDLKMVLGMNQAKLNARYKAGFTTKESLERKD